MGIIIKFKLVIMNHRILLTFTLMLLLPHMQAQQASRFPIKSGSMWRINYEYSGNCFNSMVRHENGDEEYVYFIDGDTIIGTRDYFKLHKSGILYLDTPFQIDHRYMGAIRDSANRFYYITEGAGSEEMLYDFTISIGDSVNVDGVKYPVDIIDTLENGRKRYLFFIINVHCGSENTIIEGIGWLGGLLEGNSCSSHPGVRGSYLVCYSEDGLPVYETNRWRCDYPPSCSNGFTGVESSPETCQPEVIILPGRKLKIRLADDPDGIYDITLFDESGRLAWQIRSELTRTHDISNLGTGIYFLTLRKDHSAYATRFFLE